MDITWNLAFSFPELLSITKVFVETKVETVVLEVLLILPMAEVPPEHFRRMEPNLLETVLLCPGVVDECPQRML